MPAQIRRPAFRQVEEEARNDERERCAKIAQKASRKRISPKTVRNAAREIERQIRGQDRQ